MKTVIRTEKLTKRFGDLTAVDRRRNTRDEPAGGPERLLVIHAHRAERQRTGATARR